MRTTKRYLDNWQSIDSGNILSYDKRNSSLSKLGISLLCFLAPREKRQCEFFCVVVWIHVINVVYYFVFKIADHNYAALKRNRNGIIQFFIA